MLQINTVMCGELASPGVRYPRVQQNISGLPNVSTSMRGDPAFIHFPVVRQPESCCNPSRVTSIWLNADMQVITGGQIQASGLGHPVGWSRSHVAVVTEGYVPVVCESEAQRLAPIMILQINILT